MRENQQFPSTVLSILFGIAKANGSERSIALGRFCERYTGPMVSFLYRARLVERHHAEDIVHNFWVDKLLEPAPEVGLVAKYLKTRSGVSEPSFRHYLCKSLVNYVIGLRRLRQSRLEGQMVQIPDADILEAVSERTTSLFDVAWANHLLKMVLLRVRQECEENDHDEKWTVFVELVLGPSLGGTSRPSYAELASRLRLEDPKQIGNAWITVKRMFMRHFRIAVQDYLPAETIAESVETANQEVQSLLFQLSRSGQLALRLSDLGISETDESDACSDNIDRCFEFGELVNGDLYRSIDDYRKIWQWAMTRPITELLGAAKIEATDSATLLNLLEGHRTNEALLLQWRDQAKTLGQSKVLPSTEGLGLPREIFAVLYLLIIMVAKQRFGVRLSSLSQAELEKRIEWTLSLPWIDSEANSMISKLR